MIDEVLKSKLADTVFIVEATSYEHLALWRESALQADSPEVNPPVDWRQDSEGCFVELGRFDGRPVMLSLRWDIIDNCRVMFIDSPSEVQDWRMIDEWLAQNCTPPKWDRSRPARCDAMNFHHCLDAIRARSQGEKG